MYPGALLLRLGATGLWPVYLTSGRETNFFLRLVLVKCRSTGHVLGLVFNL